ARAPPTATPPPGAARSPPPRSGGPGTSSSAGPPGSRRSTTSSRSSTPPSSSAPVGTAPPAATGVGDDGARVPRLDAVLAGLRRAVLRRDGARPDALLGRQDRHRADLAAHPPDRRLATAHAHLARRRRRRPGRAGAAPLGSGDGAAVLPHGRVPVDGAGRRGHPAHRDLEVRPRPGAGRAGLGDDLR